MKICTPIPELLIDQFIALHFSASIPYVPLLTAGFPSPAADFIDLEIDLGKELIKNPSATFLGRVKGTSMVDVGISDGDLIIIDKSIKPETGQIAVCFLNGEFTVKKIRFVSNGCWLIPENKDFKSIFVSPNDEFMIWGIVIHVIKSF
jgi:DNA polymerase V